MKNMIKNYWAMSIPVVILLIAVLFLINRKPSSPNRVIGMVDAEFVDVAAQYPGRLDSLLVQQGDTVQQGQLLAVLRTSEIHAIQQQALSAIEAAESNLNLLKNGPRPEAIQSAENLYEIAQHQYNLLQKTYERMRNLFQDNVISGQEKDLVYFKLQAAKKEQEIARLHLQSLRNGSRPEMIRTAAAILEQAKQGYALTESIAENTHVYAPASGIISSLIISEGEIVSIGYPMMTLQKENSYYVQFNIRQDQMDQIQLGTKVQLTIPGCEPEEVTAKITQIAPALDFANWVPEAQSGEFELRTFTIRSKPIEPIKGLRPGMTAALKLPE